jgi:hypothetical protein
MLIESGRIEAEGDPKDVVRRYFELTLEHRPVEVNDYLIESLGGISPDYRAEIAELRIRGSEPRKATIPQDTPIEVEALIEVKRPVMAPGLRLEIRTEHGARVFSPSDPQGAVSEFAPGQQVRAHVTIENRLSPGPYRLNCVLLHADGGEPVAASPNSSLAFEVSGAAHPGTGLVSLAHDVRFEPAAERELSPR